MRVESNTQAPELARQICVALGSDWHLKFCKAESRYEAEIQRAESSEILTLRVNTSWSPAGMVYVVGQLPLGTPSPSINVSERKTPEQMARDVERRLLPGYREALVAAEREQARDLEALARGEALARELGSLAGREPRPTHDAGYWRLSVADVELSVGPQYTPSAVHPDDPREGRGVVRIERGSLTSAQARAVIVTLTDPDALRRQEELNRRMAELISFGEVSNG
jgi:hypothetical protein